MKRITPTKNEPARVADSLLLLMIMMTIIPDDPLLQNGSPNYSLLAKVSIRCINQLHKFSFSLKLKHLLNKVFETESFLLEKVSADPLQTVYGALVAGNVI
jgi:hypothetical protein